MSVEEQSWMFLTLLKAGWILGAGYDLLNALWYAGGSGRFLRKALDLGFGLLCAAAMIAAGLYLRQNPFRLFAFWATTLGFALYMITLGTIVRVLQRKIHAIVKKS